MDMLPPEAPPASTQSVYQEANRAFDRLVGLQAWLAAEQADIPALPDTVGTGALAPYLAAVDAYWEALPTEASIGTSRRSALADRLAGASIDLALLAHEDGNLDDASLILVRSLVATRSIGLLPHVQVRELLLGDTAYAGVLLIQDEQTPDRTLVFSHDRGWESFSGLNHAHAEMERRVRRTMASTSDLPGVARQNLPDISPVAFVDSREIGGDPFKALVDRALDVRHDKLRQAWFEFALASGSDSRTRKLADTVFDTLRLDSMFDVASALAARHAALVESFNAQRLAGVPVAVADGWKNAQETYLSTLSDVTDSEADAGLSAPQGLSEYAVNAIGERLRALGVTHAPSDIHVRIDRGSDPDARLESLQSLFEGPTAAHIKLVDLAYQNIATFMPVRLSASGNDGSPIAQLDDATIRHLVRDLDLSSRYQAYVDATFRSGAEGAMRRAHASRVRLAHMQFQATESRLAYYLADAPRWFRTERAERGFRWIQAVLDAPVAANRARVEGHEIHVRQMTYRNTPLRDILVIGVRDSSSVPNIVLYTPDAPDGITFREFDDRSDAARRFFYHPAFREYLLDRLPVEYAEALPNGSGRKFAGSRLANWVLGADHSSAYTWTAEPFEERDVAGDFLDAGYDVDVQHGVRNTQAFTRSASEANWQFLTERTLSSPAEKMIEAMLIGVVTAPGHAAKAAWRLYDNVKAGDNGQAFVDFSDFYMASLSVAPPLYALSTGTLTRGIVGARFRAAGRLVETRPAMSSAVIFESRFIAKDIRKSGHADRDGIFSIHGGTYIEHNGNMYGVRYDGAYATWRLARPNGGGAFLGPAIQRTPAGTWAFREVGLPGGSGRGVGGSSVRPPELFDEYVHELEQAFTDPVERELVRMQMRSELTGGLRANNITPAQRIRWNEAAARAHERVRNSGWTQAPQTIPVDLGPREAPPGFRHVLNAEVPDELWYYGERPYKNSDLERSLGRSGFSNYWARIHGRRFVTGATGIRVTTVPPTAPFEDIRRAMGDPNLRSWKTFSVRIRTRQVADLWTANTAYGPRAPTVNLLLERRGQADVFYLQPTAANWIRLYRDQFEVIEHLPRLR